MKNIIALLGAFAAAASPAANIVLDATSTEVLVAPKAYSATCFAADELTNFLSRVFGSEVPIVKAPSPGRKQIVVGVNSWSQAEGIDPEASGKDDGFVIKATPDRVYLCGTDGSWGEYARMFREGRGVGFLRGRRSSSFAVYEFLERYCGCRFFWPGELGEIAPRQKSVSVPLGEQVFAPKLIIRKYYHPKYGDPPPWKDNGWIEGDGYSEGRGITYSWSRLRMSSFDIPCCHGINGFDLLRRFGKDHPEYFALKKDGTRFMKYEGYESSRHGNVCLSSKVVDEIYEDVKSYLMGEDPSVRKIHQGWGGKWGWSHSFRDRKYVDIMPNDSHPRCYCEKCAARYNDADPTGNYMTELVWGYTRDLANRLIADKVPGFVTQMAYAEYRRVPDFDIPTNVLVMVAKTGPFSIRDKERLERDNAEIRKWKNKTGNVWIWTYPNKYGKLQVVGLPTMTPRAWGRYYKMVAPDIFGAFAESECDRFFFNHLNYYVFSKVCWDPDVDVEEILADYFKQCYGAAAPEADRFCRELEDKFLGEVVGAYEMTSEGPKAKAASVRDIWTKIYSPAVLAEWGRLLDRGAAKLAPRSPEARRFALFRNELLGVMKRSSDAYIKGSDAETYAKEYRKSPPKRNIVRRDVGWYSLKEDENVKIVSDRSIKVVSTENTATALFYLDGGSGFALKPSTRYRISFFIKGEDIKPVRTGGGAGITLCDAYNHSFPKPTSLAGTFDWMYQSFELKTEPETNIRCRSYIYLRIGGATGTAWFDGLSIEEIPDLLAEPGKCVVVVDKSAPEKVRFAASELSRILTRRFSGKKVPVVSARPKGKFAFFVGAGPWMSESGIDTASLSRGAFAVKTGDECVFMCGADDGGTLSAVYDFLEKTADCRFFFQDELGEFVRTADDLPIQKLDYSASPIGAPRPVMSAARSSERRGKRWFFGHFDEYVASRKAWNADVKENVVRTDYLNRMFGPTVVQWHMGRLLDSFREKWKAASELRGSAADAESAKKALWEEIFTEKVVADYGTMLDSAAKSARKQYDPLVGQRIEFYRKALYEPLAAAREAYAKRVAQPQ